MNRSGILLNMFGVMPRTINLRVLRTMCTPVGEKAYVVTVGSILFIFSKWQKDRASAAIWLVWSVGVEMVHPAILPVDNFFPIIEPRSTQHN